MKKKEAPKPPKKEPYRGFHKPEMDKDTKLFQSLLKEAVKKVKK